MAPREKSEEGRTSGTDSEKPARAARKTRAKQDSARAKEPQAAGKSIQPPPGRDRRGAGGEIQAKGVIESSSQAAAVSPGPDASGTLKIKLVKSSIGYPARQRAVLVGLGLRRLHQVVERQNTPAIRGMVAKVAHLVDIVS